MIDYRSEITAYIEHEINTIRSLDVEAINEALNVLHRAVPRATVLGVDPRHELLGSVGKICSSGLD